MITDYVQFTSILLQPNKIDTLRSLDEAYYNGKALVSDEVYDKFRAQAQAESPNDPYFSEVGAPGAEHLKKVKLRIHMGSQNKATNAVEMSDWTAKMRFECGENVGFVVSEKLDGSSCEAVYSNGRLVRVATRGDGLQGSDITANAWHWKNLPKHIPLVNGTLVVRGEAILPIDAWKAHFDDTANPRNAGNGTIMRKEGGGNQHMTFIAFDCSGPEQFSTYYQKLEFIRKHNFTVVDFVRCANDQTLDEVRQAKIAVRSSLNHEIDGLIVAVDNLADQARLGFSDGGTRPKGQIAWKFANSTAESKVIGFELSIGHTGAIIPTMKIEPVFCAGVTISSILMNNFDYVAELGANVGDIVEVERAGDVIPHVSRVLTKNNPIPYKVPAFCPVCNSILVKEGRVLRCDNDDCMGKTFQRVRNWINKTDIKFFGDVLLEAAMDGFGREKPMISDIPDLYTVTAHDLAGLKVGSGQFGMAMAAKVITEINKTRTMKVDLFMGSLSIKYLGRSMGRHIGLDSPQEYFDISETDLRHKPNMGENKARDMKASIMARKPLIDQLLKHIQVQTFRSWMPSQTEGYAKVIREQSNEGATDWAPAIAATKESRLGVIPCSQTGPLDGVVMGITEAGIKKVEEILGKSFCFTGVRMSPEESEQFQAMGGIEKSGVSKGLDYLVQKDEKSESSKTKKARDVGTTIIGIETFRTMLNFQVPLDIE